MSHKKMSHVVPTHVCSLWNTNSHAPSAAPSPEGSPIYLCQAMIRGMGIDHKATRYIAISRYIAITRLGFRPICSQGQGHLCCSLYPPLLLIRSISPDTRAHTQSLPLPPSPSPSLPLSLSLSLSLPPSLSLPFSLSLPHTRARAHTQATRREGLCSK